MRKPLGLLRLLPVFVPLLVLLGTGIRGLDLGHHWDERHYQIGPVETMVRTGRFLPGFYGYPSFNYWVSTAALLPEAAGAALRGDRVRERLLATIPTHGYLLRLRWVFLGLSGLAVLWVYLCVLSWRQSVPEAALAASLLALSWEVAYHIRWVATDGVVMQFGALTILMVVLSQTSPQREWWLYPAAVAAGLGAGTKYPAGLLLVPVLLAGVMLWHQRSQVRITLSRSALLAGLAGAAFVISTPAMVFEPVALLEGIRYEIAHYGSGHAGHTVRRGPEHLLRMADYFALSLFSWYAPIAALLTVLVAFGIWGLKDEPRMGILFLSFPILYVLYFSTQRAMVVRNLLVVAPFLAILAARGAAWLWHRWADMAYRCRPRQRLLLRARYAAAAVLVIMLGVNAGWLWHASTTIRQRHTIQFVSEALSYVQARPNSTFYLSPRVAAHFALLGPARLPNAALRAADADYFVFYAHEAMRRWQDWPANRRRLSTQWFGPYEVNFNIYPNWWGDDRIVLMPASSARQLGVLVFPLDPR